MAEAAASHRLDGVGCAPVHFYEDDQFLPVPALRVFDADVAEAEDGHSDSQHLAGTEVSVDSRGFLQETFEIEAIHDAFLNLNYNEMTRKFPVNFPGR